MSKRALFFAALLLSYGISYNISNAQDDLAGSNGKMTLEDLNKLHERVNYLLLRKKIEATQLEIETFRKRREELSDPTSAASTSKAPALQSGFASPMGILPPQKGYAVARVSGTAGTYSAVLLDTEGRWFSVEKGDKLGSDLIVKKVSLGGVFVADKNGSRLLPFASSGSGASKMSSSQPQLGGQTLPYGR